MEISQENLNKAVAHIFLACIDDKFIVYYNPLEEIEKRCNGFKQGLKDMFSTGNDPFPQCVSPETKEVIVNMLFDSGSNLTEKTDELLSVVKRIKLTKRDRESINKAIRENKDVEFVKRVLSYPDDKKKQILLEWASDDLEEVFDQVKTDDYDKVLSELSDDEKESLDKIREVVAKNLNKLLKRNKVLPLHYKGTKQPSERWIKERYLPFYITNVSLKSTPFEGNIFDYEKMAYKSLIENYKKFIRQKKLKKEA